MAADSSLEVLHSCQRIPYVRAPRTTTATGIPIFTPEDGYTRNYDAIARKHLATLDTEGVNPFMSEATWDAIDRSTTAILNDVVRAGDTLLDAGVGLGRLLSHFPQNERYGVDVSLDYLERTKRQGVHVAMARLEDLPYPDEAFDCIISTDVLEHVLDFYLATREIVRVLKPGGHLVLRVPLEEDMRAYYEYREFDYVHVRRFDLWSLRLHFERLLGLEHVLHQSVLPTYRGVSTARLRTLDDGEAVRRVLEGLPADVPGHSEMLAFSNLTPEIFEAFMNAVAIHHREVYEKLVVLISGYLEINMVFRRPQSSGGGGTP